MLQHINRVEQLVIVDTTLLVKWFFQELSKAPVAEYNVGELIAEAIQALSSQTSIAVNIQFLTERLYEHYHYKTNCATSAKIISVTWMAFVGAMMDIFENNNLWDVNGHSRYYYRMLSGYDIVLSRFEDNIDALFGQTQFYPSEGIQHDNFSGDAVAA